MLTYPEAHDLLSRHGDGAPWIRHCIAVSRVAGRLADILAPRGVLDGEFLRVGALLHDIGRSRTHDPVQHGVEGYRLLTELGHHREAFVCASHIFCGFGREEAVRFGLPDIDFHPRTLEERLVPLLDSVVELDRPTTLEARISSIRRRYEGNPWFVGRIEQAARRADLLLAELKRDFGVSLEQVAAEALGTGPVTTVLRVRDGLRTDG